MTVLKADRHGRGLRGRLVPPGVPFYRTRSQQFDDMVLDAVARLDQVLRDARQRNLYPLLLENGECRPIAGVEERGGLRHVAKPPEGLGLDHVAQAHATVLLEKVEDAEEMKSMSAVIENQRHLEDVVRDLLAEVHGTTPQRQTVKVKVFDTEDIT